MAENSLEDIRNGGIFTFGLAFNTYHRHQLRFIHSHIVYTYKQDSEVVLCHTVRWLVRVHVHHVTQRNTQMSRTQETRMKSAFEA